MKVFFFNDTATTEICTLSLHDALPVFLFVLFVLSVVPSSGQEAEFFEARVRPVLVENCFRCHGPQKQMSGLRLDSHAALDRKSTRLNSSHANISYAVFCLKKKKPNYLD